MKAINICADEAKEIKYLPNNTVLISINEPWCAPYPLQVDRNSSKVLTVSFPDCTNKIEMLNTFYYPIDSDICLKILDFINLNLGKNIIVHCAAGVSRSAAICLYLHLFHNYELKPHFWSLSKPNPYVLGKLIIKRNEKIWGD